MFVVDNDEDEIDHEEAVQHLNLPNAVTLSCDSTLPFSDPFSFDLPEKRKEAESSHFPFSDPFSFEQAPTSVTPKTPIPCDSASFSYDLVTVLGDDLQKDLRSSNPKLESQNEELEEDQSEAATDAVVDDLSGETNYHQTLDDYSLADPVPDIIGKQKDTFPPTMTSFDIFDDDVISAAAVPVIHIEPFDPSPQLPIHVPYFHSSCRHHFSGFFARFDPGIAQESGSIPEDIIRNVVSATKDGFLTIVRRSYGIKPLHLEEFTSCAATIGYPLHSGKTGLEVSILMNRADAFLALVSICNSAINNPVSTAKGLTSIQYPSFYSYTTLLPDLQVFDQLPNCQIDVWEAIASVCTDNGSEGVLFVLFKVMSRIGIKHDDHTFNSMLKVCSWELLNYRKHVHSVVNSFNAVHFNYGCVLDDYEGFDEAESAICNHVIYNAMNDGLVSMGIFEDALVMFWDMDRPCCCPTKASCELSCRRYLISSNLLLIRLKIISCG